MSATMTERRRNMYADTCRVCGADVDAGAGWLYSLTDAGKRKARFNRRGGFAKFVKCDRCHTLKAVHRTDLPENRPAPVVYQTVSVKDVRAGKYEAGSTKRANGFIDPVVWLVLADGSREVVACLSAIDAEPMAAKFSTDYIQPIVFNGKVLASKAAAAELDYIAYRAVDVFEGYFTSGLWAGWSDEV